MNSLTFTVPGRPQAQARPRVTTRSGHAQTYIPKSSVEAKNHVALCLLGAMAKENHPGWPQGPVAVEIVARFPYSKGTSKKRRIDDAPMVTKPDVDNVAKTVMDALNSVCLYDDAQIARLEVSKVRCTDPLEAGLTITIRGVEEGKSLEEVSDSNRGDAGTDHWNSSDGQQGFGL